MRVLQIRRHSFFLSKPDFSAVLLSGSFLHVVQDDIMGLSSEVKPPAAMQQRKEVTNDGQLTEHQYLNEQEQIG